MQIRIIGQETDLENERRRVREALLAAGVIRARSPIEAAGSVLEEQLAAAAEALALAGPLSEQIIAARNDR